MPVTELLERNAREHGNEIALIELNPTMEDPRKLSFKEYDLVQQTVPHPYRRQITWQTFDEKANRVANMLIRPERSRFPSISAIPQMRSPTA